MSDSEEKEVIEVEKGPVKEEIKKVSLTDLMIFILSVIVVILFVVQIAINTDDMKETETEKAKIITNKPSSTVQEFNYPGTQQGSLVTK